MIGLDSVGYLLVIVIGLAILIELGAVKPCGLDQEGVNTGIY